MAAIGAAYGTSKAGIGISGVGTLRPELIMKVRFSDSDGGGEQLTRSDSLSSQLSWLVSLPSMAWSWLS